MDNTLFLYPQVAVLQRFTEIYDIWTLIWIINLSKILRSKKMSKSPTSNQRPIYVDYGVSFIEKNGFCIGLIFYIRNEFGKKVQNWTIYCRERKIVRTTYCPFSDHYYHKNCWNRSKVKRKAYILCLSHLCVLLALNKDSIVVQKIDWLFQ